jgi:hypothetical protein
MDELLQIGPKSKRLLWRQPEKPWFDCIELVCRRLHPSQPHSLCQANCDIALHAAVRARLEAFASLDDAAIILRPHSDKPSAELTRRYCPLFCGHRPVMRAQRSNSATRDHAQKCSSFPVVKKGGCNNW